MDLKLSEKLRTATEGTVLDLLCEQLKNWTPVISEAIERTSVLETLTGLIRIDGRSLEEIFGQKNIERFLAVAKLLNSFKSKEHLIAVLNDLISILCLMGCIVENLMHLRWALLAENCATLCGKITANYAENEELYRNLFDVLKLFVPIEDILRVASNICAVIRKGANSLATYISANWSKLVIKAGWIAFFMGTWATIFLIISFIFNIFKSSKGKKK